MLYVKIKEIEILSDTDALSILWRHIMMVSKTLQVPYKRDEDLLFNITQDPNLVLINYKSIPRNPLTLPRLERLSLNAWNPNIKIDKEEKKELTQVMKMEGNEIVLAPYKNKSFREYNMTEASSSRRPSFKIPGEYEKHIIKEKDNVSEDLISENNLPLHYMNKALTGTLSDEEDEERKKSRRILRKLIPQI